MGGVVGSLFGAALGGVVRSHIGPQQIIDALDKAQDMIDKYHHDVSSLKSISRSMVGIEPLVARPGDVTTQVDALSKAGKAYREASDKLKTVTNIKLPAVWQGAASQTAARAVDALVEEFDNGSKTISLAASALSAWGNALSTGCSNDKKTYDSFVTYNNTVQKLTAQSSVLAVKTAASNISGIIVTRKSSLTRLLGEAKSTAQALNNYTNMARAHLVTGLDSISAELIAYSGKNGPAYNTAANPHATIVTDQNLIAGSEELSGLSQAERTKVMNQLDSAKTSMDKADTWNELAKGKFKDEPSSNRRPSVSPANKGQQEAPATTESPSKKQSKHSASGSGSNGGQSSGRHASVSPMNKGHSSSGSGSSSKASSSVGLGLDGNQYNTT